MTPPSPLTTIILVNWRGCGDTLECLEALLRMARQDFNVIVCDNGSGDGSIERLVAWAQGPTPPPHAGGPWSRLPARRVRETFDWQVLRDEESHGYAGPLPFLTVVALDENRGFAGGNNVGVALARRCSDVRYLWFLNNDTVVEPGCYAALLDRFAGDPTIGQCGPTIAFYAAPDRVQALGGSSFRWTTARGRHIGIGTTVDRLPDAAGVEAQMAYVSGASLMIRRDLMDLIGFMGEDYFLYCEELDLALRSPAPFRLAWARQAVLWHKEGASIGSRSTGRPSDTSLYYLTRNALVFVRRHRPLYLLPVIAVRIILDGLRHVDRGDMRAVRILMLASMDALRGHMGKRTVI